MSFQELTVVTDWKFLSWKDPNPVSLLSVKNFTCQSEKQTKSYRFEEVNSQLERSHFYKLESPWC